MTPPEVRTPDGNRASANNQTSNITSLPTAVRSRNGKTGHNRYARFFPERFYFAVEHLPEREFVAWQRLVFAFVVADGALAADDKQLALLTKTGKRWPELRDMSGCDLHVDESWAGG